MDMACTWPPAEESNGRQQQGRCHPDRPTSKFRRRAQPRQIAYHSKCSPLCPPTAPARSCAHTATFIAPAQPWGCPRAAAQAAAPKRMAHNGEHSCSCSPSVLCKPLTPSPPYTGKLAASACGHCCHREATPTHEHCCTCNAATTSVLNKPTLAAGAGSEQQAWQQPPPSGGQ
jgi:hypothetical protein